MDVLTFLSVTQQHTPGDHYIGLTDILNPHIRNRWYKASNLPVLIADIEKLNGRVNVFMRITPVQHKPEKGRGLEKDASGSSVLWLDYDCYDKQELGLERLLAATIKPTLIINSGKGLQAYWQLNRFETDLDAIKSANKALYQELAHLDEDADSCYDLARIMRVPGSNNLKYDPIVPVTVLVYDPTRVYDLSVFKKADLDNTDSIAVWDQDVLPPDFLGEVKIKNKRLYARIKSEQTAIKNDAPLTADGVLDRSRNDAYCVMASLALGYTPAQCLALLTDPNFVTGAKYNATQRYDYAVMTVNKAYKAFSKSPDQYFIKTAYQTDIMVKQLQTATPFIYAGQKIRRYENGYYQDNGEQWIRSAIVEKLGNRWSSRYTDETLQWIKDANYIPLSQCNNVELVNCANGMLDIYTGELKPHDQKYRSIYQIPSVFDRSVDTSVVDQFVADILPPDSIKFFWEFLGSCLITNKYWPKAFLFLVGSGDSGKSTLLAFISAVLGIENIAAMTMQKLSSSNFATLNLVGKLANIYADLNLSEVDNVGQIKALTGNDMIDAEKKFGDQFQFTNTARLIFSANDYVPVKGADPAFFKRIKIVRCVRRFTTLDSNIDRILSQPTNLSAGLLRAFEGLQRLIAQNDFTPALSMQDELVKYHYAADSVYAFVTMCKLDPQVETAKQTLYTAYVQSCNTSKRIPVSEDKFYRRMVELKGEFNITDRRQVSEDGTLGYYVGIKPPNMVLTFTQVKTG